MMASDFHSRSEISTDFQPKPPKQILPPYVLSDSRRIIAMEETADARLGDLEQHVGPDFCTGRAAAGENPAPDCRVHLSGVCAARFRETGTGAAQPLRPGGAALALEYGPERHYRQRQLAH